MPIDLDLDAIAPPERTFVLNGNEYHLPGDLPARTVARFMRMAGNMTVDDVANGGDQLDEMVDMVAALLHRYNPQYTADEIAEELPFQGLQMIVGLAAGSPGASLEDAVVDTLTAGAQPEAAEVDREDPTDVQPVEQTATEPEPAAA